MAALLHLLAAAYGTSLRIALQWPAQNQIGRRELALH